VQQKYTDAQSKQESSMRDIALTDAQRQSHPRSPETQAELEAADDLLKEIDEVLADVTASETAEQFVRNFQQRGGE
jgi:ubiquitin-like protein Pup